MVITIIGGGFSGILTAINLIRYNNSNHLFIKIIEKDQICEGTAYSTKEDCHFLNVPAEKMSIFKDEPDHFLLWLKSQNYRVEKNTFISRRTYSDYVHKTFMDIVNSSWNKTALEVIKSEATNIKSNGHKAIVTLKNGREILSDKVVIALGNLTPTAPEMDDMEYVRSKNYFNNPWKDLNFGKSNDTFFLIGTGLTMVDMAMSLSHTGHKGKIMAFSRHGNLPYTHSLSSKYPEFTQELGNAISLLDMFGIVKKHIRHAEKEGINRMAVIDSLRPVTQELWQKLSLRDKKMFLRHIKHHWDVIRHRIPKESSKSIDQLIKNGQLKVLNGKLKSIKTTNEGFRITYLQVNKMEFTVDANKIINCTGPSFNFEDQETPLIKNLFNKGHVKNAPVGFGIDALPDGRILNSQNVPSEILYTLGPPLKGILWESTAVNEIRIQANLLAINFIKDLKSAADKFENEPNP